MSSSSSTSVRISGRANGTAFCCLAACIGDGLPELPSERCRTCPRGVSGALEPIDSGFGVGDG
eukprot:8549863-Pyramimonas_sp.AAC.1